MGEGFIVSGSDGVRVYAGTSKEPLSACSLKGAGALCTAGGEVFAAGDEDNAIWRLNGDTLMPTGVFHGGPGIVQLLPSGDGKRLYALCAEADSLLMLSAKNGAPMLLSRAGVNPCAMAMDERGETIAVAGGACGEVLLLSAHSLCLNRRLGTCGMVFSVAIGANRIYALSLTETMNSVLTSFLPGGKRHELPLCGMPGALCLLPGCIAAATHRGLYFAALDGSAVLRRFESPGRAGRLFELAEGILMTDIWNDTLFHLCMSPAKWRRIAQGVRDCTML